MNGDDITPLTLWVVPGARSTPLAQAIAGHTRARFVTLSAVSAGVADLRKVVDEARKLLQFSQQRTILFIAEIHRFNKAQQDAVLLHVERGTVTLIGATPENPSFEVNSALLSRTRGGTLKALTEEQVETLLRRALEDRERGLGKSDLGIEDEALHQIAIFANGDARAALNVLELAAQGALSASVAKTKGGTATITVPIVEEVMQHRALLYDKGGDQHYD